MNTTLHFRLATCAQLVVLMITWCHGLTGQEPEKPKKPTEKLTDVDLAFCEKNGLTKYAQAAEKWKADAKKLSQDNATAGSPETILCLGSSSFRLWNTIDHDMHPYKILRRAYGGAKYCDLAIHAPALVQGLDFKAAMIFVGNDITGSELDKTPDEIVRLSGLVIDTIRGQKPDAKVFLIAVTPTPSRFKHWSRIQQANEALEKLAKGRPNTYFVRTQDHYLTDQNEPRPELFVKDMLHQNADGYRIWSRILKESLADQL
jgi:hypothetical protein